MTSLSFFCFSIGKAAIILRMIDTVSESTLAKITGMRRWGLTWDEIANFFGVSPQDVMYWASGRSMPRHQEETLEIVLEILDIADRGSHFKNRKAIFDVTNGPSPYFLLKIGRFRDAKDFLGEGQGRGMKPLKPLSPEAQDARRPLPPEDLVDAKTDCVHRDLGKARGVSTVRSRSKKRRETLPFLRNQIGWSVEDAAEAWNVTPKHIAYYELEPEFAPIGYLTFLATQARKLGWYVDLGGTDGWVHVYDDKALFLGTNLDLEIP